MMIRYFSTDRRLMRCEFTYREACHASDSDCVHVDVFQCEPTGDLLPASDDDNFNFSLGDDPDDMLREIAAAY